MSDESGLPQWARQPTPIVGYTHPTTEAVGQVRRGSSLDWCERWPEEGHNWLTTLHAGVPRIATRSCGSCGYLDTSEARETLAAALAEAEKLRALVRTVNLYGTGYRWRAPDGRVLLLHPAEVDVFVSADHVGQVEQLRAELDSERKRVLALLADLRQARQERAAIALERDEVINERGMLRDKWLSTQTPAEDG